jgi:zinc transport system ATP-binding protein
VPSPAPFPIPAEPWDPDLDLPAPWTLRLFLDGRVVFASDRHWLHPLFDLEDFLAGSGLDPAAARLVDRVTGRAAAFLVARLGIRALDTRVLSLQAVPVLEAHGVACRWRERVDRVACMTEDLLAGVQDPEAAWTLLRERRARAGRPE